MPPGMGRVFGSQAGSLAVRVRVPEKEQFRIGFVVCFGALPNLPNLSNKVGQQG